MTRLDEFDKKLADQTTKKILVIVNKARQLVANSVYEMLLEVREKGGDINTAIQVLSKGIKEGKFLIEGDKEDGQDNLQR